MRRSFFGREVGEWEGGGGGIMCNFVQVWIVVNARGVIS